MLNQNKKIFIVAEAGNNHEGSYKTAKKLIEEAAKAGADAIKFQTFKTERYVNKNQKKRFLQLEKFKLKINEFKSLSQIAKKNKIMFFSTPFDLDSAKELNNFQKIFKISSGDNNYFSLIKLVANFKKPLIISTGMSDLKLLNKIYLFIKKKTKLKVSKNNFSFMHCVSSYPAPNIEANLSAISFLKKKFKDISIGYSDHTEGMDACIVAASLGAKIIEKHFTLDNNFSKFRDHKLSLNPRDLKTMIKRIRNVEELLGLEKKVIQKSEKEGLINSRRGLVAKSFLLKGTKVKIDDVIEVRPQLGISTDQKIKVIGKILKSTIKEGSYFKTKNLR